MAASDKAKDRKQLLITWLKDAHGMEDMQIKTLDKVIKDFEGEKVIQERLKRHLKETKGQKKDIEKCLKALGEAPSKAKSLLGRLTGTGQRQAPSIMADTRVKDMLMLHGSEHFEYASYQALSAAAGESGEKDIASVAARIAKEELAMGDWSAKHLPAIVKKLTVEITKH